MSEWTTNEMSELLKAHARTSSATFGERCSAIATCAVELVAARGGTMTADLLAPYTPRLPPVVADHIAAQGARVAVLEAERDTLQEEVTRLSECAAVTEVLAMRRERSETTVVSDDLRNRLRDRNTEVAMLKAHLASVQAAGRHVCGNGDPCAPSCPGWAPARFPCSPSCTHHDAATPGHAERVRARSDAVNVQMNKGLDAAHEQGAEAMRAACWDAVQGVAQREGFTDCRLLLGALKAAIEGATP